MCDDFLIVSRRETVRALPEASNFGLAGASVSVRLLLSGGITAKTHCAASAIGNIFLNLFLSSN